ncbi:heptosyltransferase-1 [Alteromonadaceae bacterium Bs31]|nr:heptosyltransferase-1 [Alteromonadaceae bacterium Bs31]
MVRSVRQKSILVVRLSHVTDVVLASPVASLMKQHAANVRLTWVVQDKYASLMSSHPDIDQLIVWDKTRWQSLLKQGKLFKLLREIRSFRQQLRQHSYDIALDLQGLLLSSFFTWLSGAKIRIALGASQGSNWFVTKTISRNIGEETQLGSEYRYLLSQLGMPDSPWEMYISPPGSPSSEIEEKLDFRYLSEKYCVICPFSVYPHKRWPDEYWRHVSLRIRGRYKLKTVILGLERDEAAGLRIASSTGAISLAGLTSISEASDIIKHAKILIGIDTGLTHIAHAFRTPTIALFGSTCPYSYAGVETSKIIYQKRFCSPCNNKPICNGSYDCMSEITPDLVLSELKTLMKIADEQR